MKATTLVALFGSHEKLTKAVNSLEISGLDKSRIFVQDSEGKTPAVGVSVYSSYDYSKTKNIFDFYLPFSMQELDFVPDNSDEMLRGVEIKVHAQIREAPTLYFHSSNNEGISSELR